MLLQCARSSQDSELKGQRGHGFPCAQSTQERRDVAIWHRLMMTSRQSSPRRQNLRNVAPPASRVLAIAMATRLGGIENSFNAPANPAGKKPGTCWILNVVKNGKFVRVDTPTDKFRCDGSYHYAS